MGKKVLDRALVFGTGASFYSLLETIWRGHTHWSMSLTGGLVLLTVYTAERRTHHTLWRRCLRSAGIITAYEFVVGYYLYCHYVLGFLPRSYMMIWVLMSFASFFLAMVCWYAKGEGAPAVLLSAVILGALLAQAVNLRIDRGFYVYHLMEVFTWLAGVLLLRRRGKEFAVEMGLSVVVAVLYQLILPHWG